MVTISRQAGAGGDDIARLLAADLGWRLLDNTVVEKLLVDRGFPQVKVATFNERKPDLWHRFSAEKEKYLHYLQLVSYEFARQGNCVVLGRGGQILFGSVPGILKLRVVAPLKERIRRIRSESGAEEHRARQVVLHADSERMGFHRFLFHADWDSPDLYDLLINTRLLSARAAADMVLKALGSKEIAAKKHEVLRSLEQLYLVQKAVVAILFERKLPIHGLEIEVNNGTVTLKGSAQDHPSIERCRETVAVVFAKKRINNEIGLAPKFVEALGGIHPGTAGGTKDTA